MASTAPRVAKLSAQKRALVYRQFADFAKDGLALHSVLQQLCDVAVNTRRRKDARLYQAWLQRLATEAEFTACMRASLPEGELSLLLSAERAGDVVVGFEKALDLCNTQITLQASLMDAISKPVVLFLVCLGVIAGYSLKVLPVFETVLPLEKWPMVSLTLYESGKFIVSMGMVWVALALAGMGAAIGWFLRQGDRFTRQRLSGLPPFSTHQQYTATTLLSSLSAMVGCGMPVNDSLALMHSQSNSRWLRSHLDECLVRQRRGESMVQVLNTGLLHTESVGFLAMYAESKNLASAIEITCHRSRERLIDQFAKA